MPRQLNLFAGRGKLQLEPENNLVLEVGINQLFWNGRNEGDLVWFRNDVDNMIVFRPIAGGGTQDQNAVSFVSHGIKAILTTNLSKEISASIDYTFIDQVFENRGMTFSTTTTTNSIPDGPIKHRGDWQCLSRDPTYILEHLRNPKFPPLLVRIRSSY